MITARILPSTEWPCLAKIFAEHGAALPDVELARIGVEEDGGQVVSFLVGQSAVHLEPLWQHPAYRGRLSFRRLLRLVEHELGGGRPFPYYAFSPNERIGKIMKVSGLSLLPWQVWKREG